MVDVQPKACHGRIFPKKRQFDAHPIGYCAAIPKKVPRKRDATVLEINTTKSCLARRARKFFLFSTLRLPQTYSDASA
jgi:hypothetical protein